MLSAVKHWFAAPLRAQRDSVGHVEPVPDSVPTRPVTARTRPDTDGHEPNTFRRLCAQYSHLAPRDASVGAFLVWLQDLGECWYSWEQRELYESYDVQCRLTGAEPMPWRFFGRALDGHGCHRWRQECVDDDGRRRRPMFVRIPEHAIEIQSQPKRRPYKSGKGLRVVSSDPAYQPMRVVGKEASLAFA